MRSITNKTALLLTIGVLLMGALFAPVGVVGAVQEQVLQAIPSYVNPLSGEIEDIGNNPGLGQGMTEELIKKTPATLLVDVEGKTFITIRVGLVAETVAGTFALELLDADGKASGAVPFNIIAEQKDDNTHDIQFVVPSVDSVLRVSLVSIPMGREVVGFIQFAPEGELVTIPTAEEGDVDDSAISIYENANNDEIIGVSEEDRGPLLMFLAIAAGSLVVIGGIAFVMSARKKKSSESK